MIKTKRKTTSLLVEIIELAISQYNQERVCKIKISLLEMTKPKKMNKFPARWNNRTDRAIQTKSQLELEINDRHWTAVNQGKNWGKKSYKDVTFFFGAAITSIDPMKEELGISILGKRSMQSTPVRTIADSRAVTSNQSSGRHININKKTPEIPKLRTQITNPILLTTSPFFRSFQTNQTSNPSSTLPQPTQRTRNQCSK